MDNPNPIKYSDLIKPDNSIVDAIAQLTDLIAVYDKAQAKIQATATETAKNVNGLSGATDEQRKAILSNAEATEKLLAEYKKLGEAELAAQVEKARLTEASAEERRIAKLLVEINNSAEGSYKRLSAQYRLNKIALNEMSEAQRKGTEFGRQLERETKAIYEEMNALQKATGKHQLQVGQYERALGRLVGVDTRYVEILTDRNKLMTSAKGIFKALLSPIGLVIAAIAALVAGFKALSLGVTSSEENLNRWNRTAAVFKSVGDAATRTLQDIGKAATQVAEWVVDLLDKWGLLTDAMRNRQYMEQFAQNTTAIERDLLLANAQLRMEVDLAREKASEKEKYTAEERLKFLQQAQWAERQITKNNELLAKRRLEALQAEAALSENSKEVNDALVKAEIELFEVQSEGAMKQRKLNREIMAIRREQASASRASAAEAAKEARERAKAEAENAKAIKLAEQARKKAVEARKKELTAELNSIQLQISVTKEGTQERLALEIAAIEKRREIEIFENANLAETLRQDEAAINAKYDAEVLRREADFRTELARRDLAASQDLAEAEFDLLDRNERQKTLFRLQQERDRLNELLKINATATEKMTAEEVAAIEAMIDGITKKIKRLGYNNIWELLGVKVDSDQQQALDTALSSVKDALGDLVSAWNEVADAAVAAADKQVDAAQKALDAEIEARNAGYANRVETAQKELEQARQNQQKALREQERAKKAQLALDSLEQASSLVTATANLWKAFSGAGALGIAAAVAATALMWGSFAAAKIKAAQATRQEKYGEGTVELLEGGSHASGHDIDLGTKPDGTRRRAEGGEFFAVINRRSSRRYRSVIPEVINALNDGTFADKYTRASAQMAGYAVGMFGGQNTDVSGLERDVAAIRKQGAESRYIDGQGNMVIKYKNLTRKIIKS